MKEVNEELLLNYLCMLLPYGIKVNYKGTVKNVRYIEPEYNELCLEGDNFTLGIMDVKPYLRGMDSMSDDEKEEMRNILSPEGTAIYENNGISTPMNHYGEFVSYGFMNSVINYLLKHHFDFIGFISKKLAIEVTEQNNPYKDIIVS